MKNYTYHFLITFPFYLIASVCLGQVQTDNFLKKLFTKNTDAIFQQVIQHPQEYRLQIIYTRIDRDKHNAPSFTHYRYQVDSTLYFNPASTVKLPLALLSLEKINQLNVAGVTKNTAMQFDSAYSNQSREWKDPTSLNGYPSIAHFIKKAFLVSDNDAYSRMYEFVGQETINRSLHAKGYPDTRITHRFVRMTPEENRHTNPVRFITEKGEMVYSQPAAYNRDAFDFRRVEKLGKGYYDSKDSLVQEPFDFTMRNKLPLQSLQQILQSVMFPTSVKARQKFQLTEEDYSFVYQYLSQFPGETNYPNYDSSQYYDTYVKFFFQDSLHHQLPEGVRVFNKVGWAYGFMTDVSYVADFKNKVEYMLTATLYVNSDGILNDNKYEYDTIAHPFLYQLGQTIYQYELKRKRKYKPDLSRFHVSYEKRIADGRPLIRDVDN
ncbi:serine hydrolase [Xanthocytophaga flava]|uniref:serine hydrolase n=1 Tax=Xanthocytophaga flava TaxID=3048013 RepID=UPI0028D75DF9|nr:serine hydrolase [Xanthocytophaga flavus]MDJ1466305.1 serine hydrolase [Xanthocytophaga flavus]